MASAVIDSGICGFCTTVRTTLQDARSVRVEFETDCAHVKRLAEVLTKVDPYREITYRGEGPVTLKLAAEHLVHTSCPVPSGIIKAIEVEAGLALPRDASIKPSKD